MMVGRFGVYPSACSWFWRICVCVWRIVSKFTIEIDFHRGLDWPNEAAKD